MTEYPVRRPVETKVKAAAGGAGAGVILAEVITWVLDTYVHTPGVSGDLPRPVGALVLLVCSAGAAWAAGWWARHTARPDLPMDAR